MKPVYLEFCGINSFSEKAQIDFRALLSGGVFGIFGKTGSGKSTILDCIHFALYGEIDRAPKAFNECINQKSEKAYVLFEFELTKDGVRKTYRVERERKMKAGSTKAYLYEKTAGGDWLALADGARDVDAKVEEIIGLSFADFKMCIALPQGDFAALVKSTQAERVKLVARLFDLERYGERLAKAVNEKFYKADEEVRLVEAKMEENAGGDEASIEALKTQIAQLNDSRAALQKAAEKAEENYRIASEAQKQKVQFDELKARLEKQSLQLEEMQKTRADLARLPFAKAVLETHRALQENTKDKLAALNKSAFAKAERERALEQLAAAKAELEKADYPTLVLQTTLDLEKVNAAEADMLAERTAKAQLEDCIAEYKKLQNACQAEDFEGKKTQLEKQIAELGEDGSLLDYINRHYRDGVLAEAYEHFRTDLAFLQEKYPQAQADIDKLLEKYAAHGVAQDGLDLLALQEAFKKTEQLRKTLKTELDGLEKRRRVYEENEGKKALLAEQGKLLRQNHEIAAQKIESVKLLGDKATLKKRLDGYQTAQTALQSRIEKLQEKASAHFAEWQKQDGVYAMHEKREKELNEAFDQSLKENGFAGLDEAVGLTNALGDGEKVARVCEEFFRNYNAALLQYEQTDKSKFENYDENAIVVAAQEKRFAQESLSACLQTLGGEENKLKRLLQLKAKYEELAKELAEKQKKRALCDELRTLLKSNKFLEFIASEYLQEVCLSASVKLLELTSGRYFLEYDKEFKVGDNLDAGNLRAVKTLSGGETFLVSLSLALSLSSAICSKSNRPIEFFFLDEGFGTLDGNLVDTVMDVLGKLSRDFAVGLISHVEELKHRIDNKILVTGANEKHGSLVQIECF